MKKALIASIILNLLLAFALCYVFFTDNPPASFFNNLGCDDGDIACVCDSLGCDAYDPGLFRVGFPAPLTFYTLTFKRDRHCRSQNLHCSVPKFPKPTQLHSQKSDGDLCFRILWRRT